MNTKTQINSLVQDIKLVNLDWEKQFRIISSKFPPINSKHLIYEWNGKEIVRVYEPNTVFEFDNFCRMKIMLLNSAIL